jgi:beta-aspartyl-peptidase (threonine type)
VTSAQQQPQQQQQQQQQQQPLRYALAIHGGAGVINTSNSVWISSAMEGLQAALEAGDAVLRAGGSAVDAAVASVVVMENDPHFNAGPSLLFCSHQAA